MSGQTARISSSLSSTSPVCSTRYISVSKAFGPTGTGVPSRRCRRRLRRSRRKSPNSYTRGDRSVTAASYLLRNFQGVLRTSRGVPDDAGGVRLERRPKPASRDTRARRKDKNMRLLPTSPDARGRGVRDTVGTWRHLRDNTYRAVFEFFRYNPDGSFATTAVVVRTIEVSEDGLRKERSRP